MQLTKKYHEVKVTGMHWLTHHTFEIRFSRPDGFTFQPGQKIGFIHGTLRRDYTLLGPACDAELAICVRQVPQGRFSPILAAANIGDTFEITSPFGFFTFKPAGYPAIFVATGTGIAPFVAFARSGIRDYILLHGVRTADELYFADELSKAARDYVPCISRPESTVSRYLPFPGRVTGYLSRKTFSGRYDFYLCGRNEMIRDAIQIIDDRFEGSRVYTEIFF